MGELEFEQKALVKAIDRALVEQNREVAELRLATPGGRFHVRWDEGGSATALGQLAFFAEFLEVSGLFERWADGCPMAYTSPNAPEVVDVLGTWLLSILDGHCRYAPVTALRGDEVAPQMLGMDQIVMKVCAGRWFISRRASPSAVATPSGRPAPPNGRRVRPGWTRPWPRVSAKP